MPSKLTRSALLLIACAIVIPAAGCARNKTKSDTAYIARDVNTFMRSPSSAWTVSATTKRPNCSTRSSASTPIRYGPAARS